MSQESIEWLNENTLIGFTDKRGNFWHWREGATNHFPAAIPPERVRALLKKAYAEARKLYTLGKDGPFEIPERRAIVLPLMGDHVAGTPTEDYAIHQYEQTLFERTATLINGAGYASAGLLKKGQRAWVQIEAPDNAESAGIKYRAGILAASSLDGSLATIFKGTGVFVGCDNTLAWALGEVSADKVRVKHTRLSVRALDDNGTATKALADIAERMGYAIEDASRRVVTDQQFKEFLDKLVPVPTEDGRGKTVAQNKRAEIIRLYNADNRAAPWSGSVLGVMQAVNTYNNHEATVRNADHRYERQMDNVISGKIDLMDQIAMETLNKVLVAA